MNQTQSKKISGVVIGHNNFENGNTKFSFIFPIKNKEPQ